MMLRFMQGMAIPSRRVCYRIIAFLSVVYAAQPSFGQDMLWGTNSSGGEGMGFVYRFNADGSDFKVIKTFENEGSNPGTHPLYASDGFLYGVFYGNKRSIFKIRPDGTDLAIIHSFSTELPMEGLIELNGFLYGTTWDGGISDRGTVYRIKPDGNDFTVLHEFSGSNTPGHINGGLLLASDGHLYGTSDLGGVNGTGTVFKLNTDTHAVTTVFSMGSWGGESPNGYLIEGNDGFLYGTCRDGTSPAVAGSAFKVRKDGTGFITLKNFANASNGQNIYGALTETADGALAGTFNYGGQYGSGGIYRINTDGTGFKVIHSFQLIEGSQPYGELIFHDGFLYGNTVQGGANSLGTLYKIKPDGTQFTKLVDWDKTRGKNHSSLIVHDGVIYYTAQGGMSNLGVFGTLDKVSGSPQVIRDFTPTHGGQPGKLLYHSNGFLYGRTSLGGQYGKGTLFRIDPTNDHYELLIHFKEDFESCDLIEKANGNILGAVRSSDGVNPSSEIFEYDFTANAYKLVYRIDNQYLSHIWESYNGDVMGNTASARSGGQSLVFKLDSTYSKLVELSGPGSGNQWVNVEQDTSIVMCGTTSVNGLFVVSSYDYLTGNTKSLFTFDFYPNINGLGPIGPLTVLDNGKIIGAFDIGTPFGRGILYSLNTDGTAYTRLYEFNIPDSRVSDGITRVTDDLFYGVLSGPTGGGVFRFETSQGFSMVKTFEVNGDYYGNTGLTRTLQKTPRIQFYGDLRFGAVEIYRSLEKEIRIKNVGTGDLVVNNLSMPDGFKVTGAPAFTIKPGQIRKIKVVFKPTETRRYAGVLSLLSNAYGKDSLSIAGNGILVTAIEELSDSLVSIYPNPTDQKTIVESGVLVESIALFNSMGKIVKQSTGLANRFEVDLTNLSPGVYTLIVETRQGVFRKRVFKH